MSTALDAAPHGATEPAPGDEAGGPGETHVDERVVEKIAALAAGEIGEVGGVANRVLGVRVGPDEPDRRPKARARVDGSIVTLDLTLSVTYPAPVGAVTQHVREHVVERLAVLTGLSTRQVDITVTALYRQPHARRELS
jgi:uncharacterized alkaline shock family protein YloU